MLQKKTRSNHCVLEPVNCFRILLQYTEYYNIKKKKNTSSIQASLILAFTHSNNYDDLYEKQDEADLVFVLSLDLVFVLSLACMSS